MFFFIYQLLQQGVGAATTSSVVDEDAIILDGQAFAVGGPITGKPASEFETGFKQGRAKWDNREHAFYIEFGDWSGGFGHRFMDLDEDVGTFWDVNPENAPDTRRPGHLTLGPAMVVTNVATFGLPQPIALYRNTRSVINFFGQPYVGVGATVFARQSRGVWTLVTFLPGASGPADFAILAGRDGTGGALFTFFPGYTSGYLKSAIGGILNGWGNGSSSLDLWAGLAWDDKIIAAQGQNSIVYATWADGEESWNIEDEDDAEAIFVGWDCFQILPIGTFRAPWGEPAVHFYTPRAGIFALDFFARKAYPIEAGMTNFIQHAVPYNGQLTFTDGWLVRQYSNESVRAINPIDLPNKGGTPPSMSGYLDERGAIITLIPNDNHLWAAAVRRNAASGFDTFLLCYNGTGWAPIGGVIENFYPQGGGQIDLGGSAPHPPVERSLIVTGMEDDTGASTSSNVARIAEVILPTSSQAPTVGSDQFAPSGAYLITGWTDGGFSDFDGTLFRMSIDAFSITDEETVGIEYQLDNQEDSEWTQMVDVGNIAQVFDPNHRVLYFAQPSGLDDPEVRKGIRFRTVRFRITLNRGEDDTLSPEVKSLVLVYLKTPELRMEWTIPISISRMIARSGPGNDSGGYEIEGNPATVLNVFERLKRMWNKQQLLELSLPNVAETVFVKIVDMPLTADDFRDAVEGRGTITLTVIEPIATPQ